MKEALIIIDIQNDYFGGGANPLEDSLNASLRAKTLLEEFRARALPVVHVRHLSTRPGSTFFIPGTPGSEIHGNVAPIAGEKVIAKNFPNSFRDTDLLDHLRSEGVTDLVVCGMMTHMCVDATVRAAKDLGFSCTLIGDACATRELEIGTKTVAATDAHTAFLAALNYFYATVKTADEYLHPR
jgi:nicotinamidase-related amidase